MNGLAGQFGIGLMLGLIWSPCVGPTLGAAVTLASQGKQLADVALLMLSLGLGRPRRSPCLARYHNQTTRY